MKITDRPKQKTVLMVAAAVVCLALAIGGSFAAYMSQSYQKGVVSNRDKDTIRFTSNYLQLASSDASEADYADKVIKYDKDKVGSDKISIDIYIYNYVFGNTSLINENDIVYDMSIKFVNGGEGSIYTACRKTDAGDVSLEKTENGQYTTGDAGVRLVGRKPQADHYVVEIPGADLDKVKIIAVAKPRNTAYTGNQKLAVVISPGVESVMEEFSCKGTFLDMDSNLDANTYDAFNYEVTISSGKGKVTLTWDAGRLEIDKFFIDKIAARDDSYNLPSGEKYVYDKENGSLTFVMNQAEGAGDYVIPFYRKSDKTTLPTGWTAMKEYIKVKGEEITDN